MIRICWNSIFLTVILAVAFGCSTHKTNPVSPEDTQSDLSQPLLESETNNSNHNLLGTWTVTFDIESLTASVELDRALNTHYNVTTMIPAPTIQVNSWDPVEEVVDVDITLRNPGALNVFDVRLIIFTDDDGHSLLEPDDWTHLFDIPEGLYSNPFRAYAKNEPNRLFIRFFLHQENFRILCPESNFTVQFAVIASYPGNCDEPYEISNFRQDVIYDSVGSSGWIYVDVFDWQHDVSEVKIDCASIAGVNDIQFTQDGYYTWKLELVNNNGAPSGEYGAILFAKSAGSGSLELIDRLKITISESITGIPLSPVLKGFISFPYRCNRLIAEGDYAYIDEGYVGFKILDASNIYKPEIICSYDTSRFIYGAYPYHDYVFCHKSDDDLIIVDVSDPLKPIEIAEYHNSKLRGTIKFQDNYAYVIDDSILFVWDISNLLSIELVGSLYFNRDAKGWLIENNYIYLAVQEEPFKWGVMIIDISNPANPEQIGFYQTHDNLYDVCVRGDYAYISNSFPPDGISVLDVSDPANPYEINEFILGARLEEMEESSNYIYCLDHSGWLHVLDITDPLNLFEISSLYVEDYWDLILSSSVAYIRGNDRLSIVDIQNPHNPEIASIIYEGVIRDFDISGNTLYAASSPWTNYDNNPGLRIYDITVPDDPEYMASYFIGGSQVELSGNLAYFMKESSRPSELYILDVSNPASPATIGILSGFGYDLKDMVFEGDSIYTASSYFLNSFTTGGAFQRANVGDPTEPFHSGIINPLPSTDIAVSGNCAFVIDNNKDLCLIDLSDPSELEILYYIDDVYFYSIYISGTKLYCSQRQQGTTQYDFTIYDISIPNNPVKLGELADVMSDAIDVSGNFAYLIEPISGKVASNLMSVDISDPANPVIISSLDLGHLTGGSCNIQVQDNFAYVRFENSGISIIKLWD